MVDSGDAGVAGPGAQASHGAPSGLRHSVSPPIAKGPWRACKNGTCSCKQVWCDDFPVAVVTAGEWGDEWPAIRIDQARGTTGAKAEAYTERMVHGSVSESMAAAHARLIAAAPSLLLALSWLVGLEDERPADRAEQEPLAWGAARAAIKEAIEGRPEPVAHVGSTIAQGMAARSGETGTGSTEGNSPTPQRGDAPNLSGVDTPNTGGPDA